MDLAFIQNIGVPGFVIILLAILLLFGGKKLPEMARGLGKGIRHFQDELNGIKRQIEEEPTEEKKKKKST